ARRGGFLSAPAYHLSCSLSRCMVHVRHRSESREAQHLRLPESRSEVVPAGAVILACSAAPALLPYRPVPHSTLACFGGNAAAKRAVLGPAWQTGGYLDHPSSSDYLSTGGIQRAA